MKTESLMEDRDGERGHGHHHHRPSSTSAHSPADTTSSLLHHPHHPLLLRAGKLHMVFSEWDTVILSHLEHTFSHTNRNTKCP